MNTFQINVAVNIGLTPELAHLCSSLMGKMVKPSEPIAVAEEVTPVEESQAEPIAVAEEVTPVAEEPKEKEYTEVDVRDAMDRTRRRIEGDNYKDNTDSELYKKWHRKLTAFFKSTAGLLGSDKPSTLPDSASRQSFCKMCDEVVAQGDELTVNPSF